MSARNDGPHLGASGMQNVGDALLTLDQHRRQEERERMERRARQVMRDIEYRRALGLDLREDLPKTLGTSGGGRGPFTSALRATKKFVA